MAVRGTAFDKARWELSHRYLTGQIDRATHRTVIMRRFGGALKAGIEINPLADEIGVVANWRLIAETASRPALILGTSSDRIGTPAGQSYYATLSKGFEIGTTPVAPYAGISYSGYDDRLRFPFGVHVSITPSWSALVMNDGVHTHFAATWGWRRASVTALAVERKNLGLTLGIAF